MPDEEDADLGGTGPVLVDMPRNAARQAFVVALGKDGHAYLLDRDNLGGIGGSPTEATKSVASMLD
jgi:hypothetical protein